MERSAWATGSSERGNEWMKRPAWATGLMERMTGSMKRLTGLGNRLDESCSILIDTKCSFYSWGLHMLMHLVASRARVIDLL